MTPLAGDCPIVFVAGKKRSGKTTLIKDLVYTWARERRACFVVFDRNREFVTDLRGPGLVIALGPDRTTLEGASRLARQLAPCTLVVPELDFWLGKHGLSATKTPNTYAVVNAGRHEEVALLCDARRQSRIPSDLVAGADTIFFFRHTLPGDLDWIADLASDEWADAVRALPPQQFLRCDL